MASVQQSSQMTYNTNQQTLDIRTKEIKKQWSELLYHYHQKSLVITVMEKKAWL